MTSKDSVRYLGQSLMGLGDRLRQGKSEADTQRRADEVMAMQKQQFAAGQSNIALDRRMKQSQMAGQIWGETAKSLAANMAVKNKTSIEAELPAAMKATYPAFAKILGKSYGNLEEIFGEAKETGPAVGDEIPMPKMPSRAAKFGKRLLTEGIVPPVRKGLNYLFAPQESSPVGLDDRKYWDVPK